MARPIRIERPGAWCHVTARGDERRAICRDARNRLHFCQILAEAVRVFGWKLHCYVLMENHFHLLVETPEANLGRGMQWLNVSTAVKRLGCRAEKDAALSTALRRCRKALQFSDV